MKRQTSIYYSAILRKPVNRRTRPISFAGTSPFDSLKSPPDPPSPVPTRRTTLPTDFASFFATFHFFLAAPPSFPAYPSLYLWLAAAARAESHGSFLPSDSKRLRMLRSHTVAFWIGEGCLDRSISVASHTSSSNHAPFHFCSIGHFGCFSHARLKFTGETTAHFCPRITRFHHGMDVCRSLRAFLQTDRIPSCILSYSVCARSIGQLILTVKVLVGGAMRRQKRFVWRFPPVISAFFAGAALRSVSSP